MSSYVIIWENNTFGHQRVKGRTWPGHAAMNIGEKFEKMLGLNIMTNSYVSWWPAGGTEIKTKKGSSKGGIKGPSGEAERHLWFGKDIAIEEYLPDHVIRLDSDEDREANMRASWKEIYQKQGASFKFLRKNCSTIVSRVLHAGGYHARKWSLDHNFAWTPADIRKLAMAAGGALVLWDDFLGVLKASKIAALDLVTQGVPREQVNKARSGAYCTTGAPCEYQQDQQRNPGSNRDAIILE